MGSDIECHGLLLSFFKRYAFETFVFFEWAGDRELKSSPMYN